MEPTHPRALLVDLNNFARFPTLAIGYLVAALRTDGFAVEVLSPLSHGVPPTERERQETWRDQVQRRVYFSAHPLLARSHERLRHWRAAQLSAPHPKVLEETRRAFEQRRPDALLLSAYLDQYPAVVQLGELARSHGVPLLLGGPVFNVPQISAAWLDVPGLTAIVGAEMDFTLPGLVRDLVAGADLSRYPGVFLPDGRTGPPAPPLQALDALPVPDFSDFPWDRYPRRIIPVMTGRGCSWGRCLFCGDVQTANGRSFRSRPLDAVLGELEQQSERYRSKDVIFLDIKLNSDVEVWRGLLEGYQQRLPGGRWIGTVHVGARGDNGLGRDELEAARAAGMTRTTFGLETGSQRLNDAMAKGTTLERTSRFIHDAHGAGISVRATAMLSYPGEQAEDIDRTVRFLEQHLEKLDRVRLSRFKPIPGTRFHERHERSPDRYASMLGFSWDFRYARAGFRYAPASERRYRRAQTRLLNLVYRINRRPLRAGAEVFDGLM